MRGPKAGLTLLPLLRLHPLHPHSPLELCRPRPTAVVGLSIVFQDIGGRLDLPAPGLQLHAPGPLAQGQLLQAGDRKPRCFIESRSKVSKKEKKAAGGVPGAGALPGWSPGSGRVGMTQPGPGRSQEHHSPGICRQRQPEGLWGSGKDS